MKKILLLLSLMIPATALAVTHSSLTNTNQSHELHPAGYSVANYTALQAVTNQWCGDLAFEQDTAQEWIYQCSTGPQTPGINTGHWAPFSIVTPIFTPTYTVTPTLTFTPSYTPTPTFTGVWTQNLTYTATPSLTSTRTYTATATFTSTKTITPQIFRQQGGSAVTVQYGLVVGMESTYTATATPTSTFTATITPTPTNTFTSTPTFTSTSTFTSTWTQVVYNANSSVTFIGGRGAGFGPTFTPNPGTDPRLIPNVVFSGKSFGTGTAEAATISSNVCTVTHTSHGYSTGDIIKVTGSPTGGGTFNLDYIITGTATNTYTFTTTGLADGPVTSNTEMFWFKGTRSYGTTFVSAITRLATGKYSLSFSNAQADAYYGVHGNWTNSSVGSFLTGLGIFGISTSAVTVTCINAANTAQEADTYLEVDLDGIQ